MKEQETHKANILREREALDIKREQQAISRMEMEQEAFRTEMAIKRESLRLEHVQAQQRERQAREREVRGGDVRSSAEPTDFAGERKAYDDQTEYHTAGAPTNTKLTINSQSVQAGDGAMDPSEEDPTSFLSVTRLPGASKNSQLNKKYITQQIPVHDNLIAVQSTSSNAIVSKQGGNASHWRRGVENQNGKSHNRPASQVTSLAQLNYESKFLNSISKYDAKQSDRQEKNAKHMPQQSQGKIQEQSIQLRSEGPQSGKNYEKGGMQYFINSDTNGHRDNHLSLTASEQTMLANNGTRTQQKTGEGLSQNLSLPRNMLPVGKQLKEEFVRKDAAIWNTFVEPKTDASEDFKTEMKSRIEQLESDQVRSRLAMLETRMSSLVAANAPILASTDSSRTKHNQTLTSLHSIQSQGTNPAQKQTIDVQSEPDRVASDVDLLKLPKSLQSLPSHSSSLDSHFKLVNSRIDELDSKILALSPHSKTPWRGSSKDRTKQQQEKPLHGKRIEKKSSALSEVVSYYDFNREVDEISESTRAAGSNLHQWDEPSLPKLRHGIVSHSGSSRSPARESVPNEYVSSFHKPDNHGSYNTTQSATNYTSVPPSEASLPGYSIPMHDFSARENVYTMEHTTKQLSKSRFGQTRDFNMDDIDVEDPAFGAYSNLKDRHFDQYSGLDNAWGSNPILHDIVQMRLGLESTLKNSELIRSKAQHADYIATQEVEARALMDAANLNRSQAETLETSSKTLHKKLDLRTKMKKCHQEVQQFMRSVEAHKKRPFLTISNLSSHNLGSERIEPADIGATSGNLTPSRIHVTRKGSITMEYVGQGTTAAENPDSIENLFMDQASSSPVANSKHLQNMFDTASAKLRKMMGTASLRPNDLTMASYVSARHPGSMQSKPSLPGVNWVPSRIHSQKSSPTSIDSASENIREIFAEAARLRAVANEQEVMARAALERASTMRDRSPFSHGSVPEGPPEHFSTRQSNSTASKGASATQKLSQALSSFVAFKNDNMKKSVPILQEVSRNDEKKRALHFAMAELSRVNESVVVKRNK